MQRHAWTFFGSGWQELSDYSSNLPGELKCDKELICSLSKEARASSPHFIQTVYLDIEESPAILGITFIDAPKLFLCVIK